MYSRYGTIWYYTPPHGEVNGPLFSSFLTAVSRHPSLGWVISGFPSTENLGNSIDAHLRSRGRASEYQVATETVHQVKDKPVAERVKRATERDLRDCSSA